MLPGGMHIGFAVAEPSEAGRAGGTDYIGGLVQALRRMGHTVDLSTGGGRLPRDGVLVVDGLLLPRLGQRADELDHAVALIHHVSAAAGREAGAREAVQVVERALLPRMRRVIATSRPVAAQIEGEFGVRAIPVLPGARELPRSQPGAGELLILAVGVLTRRKGHDALLRAMARLTDLEWRLVIAGDAGREPEHAVELAALIEELGLHRRVTLLADPEPAELECEWAAAGLFALATHWEGYAVGVAEALRRGIPVVVTDGGEAGALVPPDAGAVCPGDDPATFGKCLRRLIFDAELRADMAEAAWQAGQKLPSWTEQARAFLVALED